MRLFLILLLFPIIISGQNLLKPNIPEVREHIYNGISEELKQKKWERRMYHFANIWARYIYDVKTNGGIYRGNPGMEAYVNLILQKILPAHLKGDSAIHVYLTQNGMFNVVMTPSGNLFLNIGVLAEIEDEATLASILAHEVAHYDQQHALKSYIKSVSGEFRIGLFDFQPYETFSIANEYQADSLAIIWVTDAGYTSEGAAKHFQIMDNIYKNKIHRIEDKWALKESTQPFPEYRLEKLKEFQKWEKTKGAEFLVTARIFDIFRKEAQKVTLQFFLENLHYNECMEKAFKYHLFNPEDADFIYYILEGIRRKCYLNPTMWKENFITFRYYESRNVESWKVKDLMKDHLFVKYQPVILQIYPFENDKVNFEYWEGEPKFATFQEAYTYYSRMGLVLGNKEVLLSNALSITQNDTIRNEYLQLYVNQENVKHKEYAEKLLTGTLFNSLPDKQLTIMMKFAVQIKQGDDIIEIDPSIQNNAKQAFLHIKDVDSKFPKRTIIHLDSIKEDNPAETWLINRMYYFTSTSPYYFGVKTEPFILEPDFWQLFNKYQVSEIEFFNCVYKETRNKENSLEAYLSVINNPYKELFIEEKTIRDFFISNISLMKANDEMVEHRYYDYQTFITGQTAEKKIPYWLILAFKEKDSMQQYGVERY